MRGVKSYAMVLCVRPMYSALYRYLTRKQATSAQGKEGGIELIQPPEGSVPGDRVYFEGEYESEW